MTASEFYQKFKRVRDRAIETVVTETKIIYTDRYGNQAIEYKNSNPYTKGLYYNNKLFNVKPRERK